MNEKGTDNRTNINDGALDFKTHLQLNADALEAFFRSMLKPVNDNETDTEAKNIIVSENFSFEPLKRIYFQDLYKSLLSGEELYKMISVSPVNNTFPGMEVVGNAVTIAGNTTNTDLNNNINNTVGGDALGPVEISNSQFHSTIEFTDNASVRTRGLYDSNKMAAVNGSGELFTGLGLLEQVFDEEERLFKEDVRRENNIISLQTIARRMVELFARLSNVRLSMLFWTDRVNDYSKEYSVAALDIFYNLMSRMSEAHRINIPREYSGVETYTETETQKIIVNVEDRRPLNVLFWVDASGSMLGTVDKLADQIVGVVNYVSGINKDCKFAVLGMRGSPQTWASIHGGDVNLCCNFTADTNTLKTAIKSIRENCNGNESIAGVYDVVNESLTYSSSCKYIWGNDSTKKFKWETGAKRIIIVFSDEPVDNYTSLSSQSQRQHHPETQTSANHKNDLLIDAAGNTKKDRSYVKKFDSTTYTYHCLPKKDGLNQTYCPASGKSSNPRWVVVPDWQFNNTYSVRQKTGETSYFWRNAINEVDEFTRANFVNSFINPKTDGTYDADKVTELHWIYISTGTGDGKVIDQFRDMITQNILKPIAKANDNNGESITNITTKTNLANTIKNIFKQRSVMRQEETIQEIQVTKTRQYGNLNATVLKFARAARLNKTYADMLRPCVFVPSLVSSMMMIVQSKALHDKGSSSSDTPDWQTLVKKVIGKSSNKYTWFGRTNQLDKYANNYSIEAVRGKEKILQHGVYSNSRSDTDPPVDDFNDALAKGGDYAESLTGIHLKLINKPSGEGWSSGTTWTNSDIDKALTGGLEILADAFAECFKDAEVMKCLDMSSNPPTPTNLWELMHDKPTQMSNLGDLQCSLILERIIAKVYSELNVKGCSYFKAKNPLLNLDFALRFLTDATFPGNELGGSGSDKYRVAYSNVLDYVKRIENDPSGIGASFDEDTRYILKHVVTDNSQSVNESFKYMLKNWSLCPYRYSASEGGATSTASVTEHEVGGNNDNYTIAYRKNAKNPTSTIDMCPFAETVSPNPDVAAAEHPHGCKLRYSYSMDELSELEDDLKLIPPTCPCRSLASRLLEKISVSKKLPAPTEQDSRNYIHALFKKVGSDGNLEDTKQEEANSMGWDNSIAIRNNSNPQTVEHLPPSYQEEYHSNVRLVYLDQLIRLCKDLFGFNMRLAFDEPYLKTKVNRVREHYYGNATYGSFEPLTCYRFSNFHALNEQDERTSSSAGGGSDKYILKYYARDLREQYITAVNRDLSGETEFFLQSAERPGGVWKQKNNLKLDNDRTIPDTELLESQKAFPQFFGYTPTADSAASMAVDVNAFVHTTDEILSGVIDPEPVSPNVRQQNISRDGSKKFLYSIHLMDELEGTVTDSSSALGSNQNKSLTTLEVWVKRFRPIFLPNAEDLFMSNDRDPLNPTDQSKSLKATGWAITPHKYSADVHFSKDAIIIPMNITSRNSPRCGWFNELDYDFHKIKVQGNVAVSGFYDDETDDITTLKISGSERDDMCKYHFRDWMYVVSMLDHCRVSGMNGAIAVIPAAAETHRVEDKNPQDGANDYTQGKKGQIPIYKSGDGVKLAISQDNLQRFDILKCPISSVDQRTALNANWLYITTRAPDSGVETSQCYNPLPWLFFHSSRGNTGAGPSMWHHGMGGRVTQNHETGFSDSNPSGMRFFAVSAVLAANPIKMRLCGNNSESEVSATADKFQKGFYDPSCCGTSQTWKVHSNENYYGWSNDHNDSNAANKSGARPDKYYNPFTVSGGDIKHVLVGDSLGASQNCTQAATGSPFDKQSNGTDYNSIIRSNLVTKPMTWSLWNLLRHSIWYCYNVADLDYDKDRIGCTVNRTTLNISTAEINVKTSKSMREMYREWYKRFTYNGQYTSSAGIGDSTEWPYKEHDDDPVNYGEAQRLLKGTNDTIGGGRCNIEWTNMVADVSIIYNEVSDTHDSCMTMYTGGHPNFSAGYTNSASYEFKGKKKNGSGGYTDDDPSGVISTSVPASWATKGQLPNSSNSKPFRYALSGVDMCRNFMALTYRGYNSSVPSSAFSGDWAKFQPHSTHPKSLQVSRTITTFNKDGKVISRNSNTADGSECSNMKRLLKDCYPETEESDTEPCDCCFLQRLLLPVYPNWEDLHDSNGNPLHPDAVTDEDLQKIVFCMVPQTYYDGLASGNDGTSSEPKQVGERMMAFCVSQFFTGVEAEKMTSTLDTEFFAKVAAPNVSIIGDDLGHDYKPGDPPWGQALVSAGNWDPSHWNVHS